MTAEDFLAEGNTKECLAALMNQVKGDASNPKLRTFLFQMFALTGQWDRAMKQLAVLKDMDSIAIPMTQMYETALRCEAMRQSVFAGERAPLVLGEPPHWLAELTQACGHVARGEYAQAKDLRDKAFEAAPVVSGKVNDTPFEWLADADSRLGPVLEAQVNGKYYWVPMSRIAKISIEAPTDLRDFIWSPANMTWANGGQAIALIPVRYPGSESDEDGNIQLARKTEWEEPSEGLYLGKGQRILATEETDYGILDVREVEFDVTDEARAESEAAMPSPEDG